MGMVVMILLLLLPGVGDVGKDLVMQYGTAFIHCCLAVYQQSITLSVAVMAILRALVALGRRKANGSSSKEIHLPAAD